MGMRVRRGFGPTHLHELLDGACDVIVESYKVGLRKPDPRIYELVCSKIGVPPSRCVYIDDIGVSTARVYECTLCVCVCWSVYTSTYLCDFVLAWLLCS
jgi:hypothetical protein